MPGGFRGEEFGHVGVGPAFLAVVEEGGRPAADHVGGFELGIGARQRKLHALVLPDRPVEDDSLLGVIDALPQ